MVGRFLDWIGEPVWAPRFSIICLVAVTVAWIVYWFPGFPR